MLRFSKVLLLSLVVVCLCASLALATTSRVKALAGASSFINDDSDVFRWYGTLPSYSKMVMAEAGSFEDADTRDQALGFTHDWGEDHWLGTWGVFLFKNSIQDGSYYTFNPLPTPNVWPGITTFTYAPGVSLPPPDPFDNDLDFIPSTKFAAMWGQDLGQVALGLMVTRSDAWKNEADEPTVNYNFTTLGAGVRVDIADALYGDAAATLGFASGKPDDGWDKTSSYNLEGRLFWEFLDNATVVPYVGYASADFALESEDDGETLDPNNPLPTGDKWSRYNVGASLNFDVNTNNMLVFAAEMYRLNWTPSDPGKDNKVALREFVFPKLYVALESDVTSWFTFRVGATKTMVKTRLTDANGDESKYSYPVAVEYREVTIGEGEEEVTVVEADVEPLGQDFTWHLGGGFHVGEWDIDAVFSHELPFRVGYWLTGYGEEQSEPIVSRVSATYRF